MTKKLTPKEIKEKSTQPNSIKVSPFKVDLTYRDKSDGSKFKVLALFINNNGVVEGCMGHYLTGDGMIHTFLNGYEEYEEDTYDYFMFNFAQDFPSNAEKFIEGIKD